MNISRSLRVVTLLLSLVLVAAVSASSAWAIPYEIVQITDNDYTDNVPQIADNGDVVWEAPDESGADAEVFLYDGVNVTQITDDTTNQRSPIASDGNITWRLKNSSYGEIMFYDGTTTTQISNGSFDDIGPVGISGNQVVWLAEDGNDREIMYYNGSTTVALTNNSYDDTYVAISGNNIVWEGNGIWLYDGVTTTQISSTGYDPEISGDKIVWVDSDGSDSEIFMYDGTSTIQLTDNTLTDNSAQISGDNVVWRGNNQIYLYDGLTTSQLTNDATYWGNRNPQVSGDTVVWRHHDDNDWEIFMYDGVTTTQLTDNILEDGYPSVSGDIVAWNGYGTESMEVWVARPLTTPVPEPSTYVLGAVGLVGLTLSGWCRATGRRGSEAR